ncbi:hypothetical protein LSH36_20g02005 [Paralvinella palmiformis]|uniref:Uncharacterized protein n=1 Tax=Paralvinella palmiformis TaxID=53620 RepID=A0AAD9KB72_9ANNE|nr:hypothetical protein LSH36_20g02005 [Paralvinella palmiformis]
MTSVTDLMMHGDEPLRDARADKIVLIVSLSAIAAVILITGFVWLYLYKKPQRSRLGQSTSEVKESYQVSDPERINNRHSTAVPVGETN